MTAPDGGRSGPKSGASGAQTTPLSDSGDVIRDEAEETGTHVLLAKRKLLDMLANGVTDPKQIMRFAGRALQELEYAQQANEKVKEIIYEKRRRS